jgi:hypothetical protein
MNMPEPESAKQLRDIRVLIPTSRDVYRLVSYGMVIDFEDAVVDASDVDLVPVPIYSRRERARRLAQRRRFVRAPRQHYDVCLLIAMAPYWVPSLRYVRGLREIADRVVVYLFDSWVSELPDLARDRRTWSLVDDLFVSFRHSLPDYADQLSCRVHYLPQAIDPRWFEPKKGKRPIDVLSVGRRLPAVHEQLREVCQRRDQFYLYQTHAAPQAMDFRENQELLGQLCRSARVHVSWRVDRTNPARAAEGEAITARWFESAASGAAVIGAPPPGAEFERLFPYPEFVRQIAPDSAGHTERVLDEALAGGDDTDRWALAEHVRSTHTWGRRWREIVSVCGLGWL